MIVKFQHIILFRHAIRAMVVLVEKAHCRKRKVSIGSSVSRLTVDRMCVFYRGLYIRAGHL